MGAAILVGIAAAGAPFAASLPSRHSRITIRTDMTVTAVTTIDADHNGKQSVGDYTIFRAIHRDLKTHKVIGGGTAICIQVELPGVFDCQGEDHLAGGDIREAFRDLEPAKRVKAAILGGTGAYRGAYGELNPTWLDANQTKARTVFTITKP